jgi:hypothetical protein
MECPECGAVRTVAGMFYHLVGDHSFSREEAYGAVGDILQGGGLSDQEAKAKMREHAHHVKVAEQEAEIVNADLALLWAALDNLGLSADRFPGPIAIANAYRKGATEEFRTKMTPAWDEQERRQQAAEEKLRQLRDHFP